jgi:predicted nucleotidyltransferase
MKSERLAACIRNSLNTKAKEALPFDIKAVLLFGSAARESETFDSDVDLPLLLH